MVKSHPMWCARGVRACACVCVWARQAYFCTMGLEVLGKLDAAFAVVPRDAFVDWIYNLQVIPDGKAKEGAGGAVGIAAAVGGVWL